VSLVASLGLLSASLTSPVTLQDNPIWTTLDPSDVLEILEEIGVEGELDEDNITWSDEDGTSYRAVFFFPEEDEDSEDYTNLMLQASLEGDGSWEAAQEWNTASRNGRAYYSEGAGYFEVDLDADGGISRENVMAVIEQFVEDAPMVLEQIASGGGGGGEMGDMVTSVSTDDLIEMLSEYGIEAEDNNGDVEWEDEDGNVIRIVMFADNDLMFQAEIEVDDADLEALNMWNLGARYGRAYYDEEGGVVRVEDDLFIGEGTAASNVDEFIRRFIEDTLPGVMEAIG